ncbi:MAG: hypothetical protein HYV33_01635 [Candidatus Kerfeldbacteria bacterium]|nr:hypothetical protein [Candidatus Kerfeldbacteria bacterium]
MAKKSAESGDPQQGKPKKRSGAGARRTRTDLVPTPAELPHKPDKAALDVAAVPEPSEALVEAATATVAAVREEVAAVAAVVHDHPDVPELAGTAAQARLAGTAAEAGVRGVAVDVETEAALKPAMATGLEDGHLIFADGDRIDVTVPHYTVEFLSNAQMVDRTDDEANFSLFFTYISDGSISERLTLNRKGNGFVDDSGYFFNALAHNNDRLAITDAKSYVTKAVAELRDYDTLMELADIKNRPESLKDWRYFLTNLYFGETYITWSSNSNYLQYVQTKAATVPALQSYLCTGFRTLFNKQLADGYDHTSQFATLGVSEYVSDIPIPSHEELTEREIEHYQRGYQADLHHPYSYFRLPAFQEVRQAFQRFLNNLQLEDQEQCKRKVREACQKVGGEYNEIDPAVVRLWENLVPAGWIADYVARATVIEDATTLGLAEPEAAAIPASGVEPTPAVETGEPVPTGFEVFHPGDARAITDKQFGELKFVTDYVHLAGSTENGGAGSKYQTNEDVMFAGVGRDGAVFSGVIDGAGGSDAGRASALAGVNASMKAFQNDGTLDQALTAVHDTIKQTVPGGYACPVFLKLQPTGQVNYGWAGDAKLVTIRGGAVYRPGTSRPHNAVFEDLQSKVAADDLSPIEAAKLYYSHKVHTSDGWVGNNVVSRTSGYYVNRPSEHELDSFQAAVGDVMLLGSDGAITDLVSEYEIELIVAKHPGDVEAIRNDVIKLAYDRNNSTAPFIVRVGPGVNDIANLYSRTIQGRSSGSGDNITLQVIIVKHLQETTSRVSAPIERQPSIPEVNAEVRNYNIPGIRLYRPSDETVVLDDDREISMHLDTLSPIVKVTPDTFGRIDDTGGQRHQVDFHYQGDNNVLRLSVSDTSHTDGTITVVAFINNERVFGGTATVADLPAVVAEAKQKMAPEPVAAAETAPQFGIISAADESVATPAASSGDDTEATLTAAAVADAEETKVDTALKKRRGAVLEGMKTYFREAGGKEVRAVELITALTKALGAAFSGDQAAVATILERYLDTIERINAKLPNTQKLAALNVLVTERRKGKNPGQIDSTKVAKLAASLAKIYQMTDHASKATEVAPLQTMLDENLGSSDTDQAILAVPTSPALDAAEVAMSAAPVATEPTVPATAAIPLVPDRTTPAGISLWNDARISLPDGSQPEAIRVKIEELWTQRHQVGSATPNTAASEPTPTLPAPTPPESVSPAPTPPAPSFKPPTIGVATVPPELVRRMLNEQKVRQSYGTSGIINEKLSKIKYASSLEIANDGTITRLLTDLVQLTLTTPDRLSTSTVVVDLLARLGLEDRTVVTAALLKQRQAIREIATAQERAKDSKIIKLGKFLGKIGTIIGVGAGTTALTANPVLGVAAVIGARAGWLYQADRAIDQRQQKLMNAIVKQSDDVGINLRDILENLSVELAVAKQHEIDRLASENDRLELRIVECRDELLKRNTPEQQAALQQAIADGAAWHQRLTNETIDEQIRQLGNSDRVSAEMAADLQASRAARAAGVAALYTVKQNDATLKEQTIRQNGGIVTKLFDKVTQASLFRGGQRLNEQVTTAAAFTVAGYIGRSVPILREVVLGIGTMKLGEVAAKAMLAGEQRRRYVSIDQLKSITDTDTGRRYLTRARAQLADAMWQADHPKEYAALREQVDRLLVEQISQASLASDAGVAVMNQLNDDLAKAVKRFGHLQRTDRAVIRWSQILGGAVGAIVGPDVMDLVGEHVKDWLSTAGKFWFSPEPAAPAPTTPAPAAPVEQPSTPPTASSTTEAPAVAAATPASVTPVAETVAPPVAPASTTPPAEPAAATAAPVAVRTVPAAVAETVTPVTAPVTPPAESVAPPVASAVVPSNEQWQDYTVHRREGFWHVVRDQLRAKPDWTNGGKNIEQKVLEILTKTTITVDGKQVHIIDPATHKQVWVMQPDKYTIIVGGTADDPTLLIYDAQTHQLLNNGEAFDKAFEQVPLRPVQSTVVETAAASPTRPITGELLVDGVNRAAYIAAQITNNPWTLDASSRAALSQQAGAQFDAAIAARPLEATSTGSDADGVAVSTSGERVLIDEGVFDGTRGTGGGGDEAVTRTGAEEAEPGTAAETVGVETLTGVAAERSLWLRGYDNFVSQMKALISAGNGRYDVHGVRYRLDRDGDVEIVKMAGPLPAPGSRVEVSLTSYGVLAGEVITPQIEDANYKISGKQLRYVNIRVEQIAKG